MEKRYNTMCPDCYKLWVFGNKDIEPIYHDRSIPVNRSKIDLLLCHECWHKIYENLPEDRKPICINCPLKK